MASGSPLQRGDGDGGPLMVINNRRCSEGWLESEGSQRSKEQFWRWKLSTEGFACLVHPSSASGAGAEPGLLSLNHKAAPESRFASSCCQHLAKITAQGSGSRSFPLSR